MLPGECALIAHPLITRLQDMTLLGGFLCCRCERTLAGLPLQRYFLPAPSLVVLYSDLKMVKSRFPQGQTCTNTVCMARLFFQSARRPGWHVRASDKFIQHGHTGHVHAGHVHAGQFHPWRARQSQECHPLGQECQPPPNNGPLGTELRLAGPPGASSGPIIESF